MARISAALSSPAGVDQWAMLPTRRPSKGAADRGQHRHESNRRLGVRGVTQGQRVSLAGLGVLQQDLRIHRHDVGCHLARRHERRGVEHVFDNADLLG